MKRRTVGALLVMAGIGTATAESALADGRTIAVYADGRAVAASGGKGGFSCQDEELVFVFEETVDGEPPPASLTLSESAEETGQLAVEVSIVEACAQGEAIFDYRHEGNGATIGGDGDVVADPPRFSVTLAIAQGASGVTQVAYAAVDDNETEEDEAVALVGERIAFHGNGNFGEVAQRRELARVTVPANTDDVVDPDDLPGDASEKERDAIDALNAACRAAQPGSELAATCNQLRGVEGAQARQVARAVDAHDVAASSGSAVETGRIQNANIQDRITEVRGGASGISVSGLSLAMNGAALDTGWVQSFLDDEAEAGGGGSSSRLLGERWGLFVNGSVTLGDRDPRGKEEGFDFESYGVTAGVDYRFGNGLILGGAFGYTRYESDVDRDGGRVNSNGYSLQGFGTFDVTDNFYIDATAAYTFSDFAQSRVIDLSGIGSLQRRVVQGSTDSEQFSTSLGLNYRAALGGGWSLTPYGSVYYADTEVDAFRERGSPLALSFEQQSFDSLVSSLGVRVAKSVNLETGVLRPFVDVAYEHESQYDPFEIKTQFTAVDVAGPTVFISEPDRDFGQATVGTSWVFPSGNQLFVRLNSLVANEHTNRYSLYIGGRFEF